MNKATAAHPILAPDEIPPAVEAEISGWWVKVRDAGDDALPIVLQDAAASLFATRKVNATFYPECDNEVERTIQRELEDMAHYAVIGSDEAEEIFTKARLQGPGTQAARQQSAAKNLNGQAPHVAPIDVAHGEYGASSPQPSPATKKTKNALVAFPLVAFKDICLDLKRSTYLVKRLLPRAGVAVIWGPPKCYKSFWAMDVALHIALGWTYRGRRVQQASVVYLCLEGKDGLPARKEAMARHYDVDDAPFHAITTKLNLAKDAAGLIASIEAQLQGVKPGAVFIDTLNRSLVGSESKDEDMQAYLAGAATISEKFCSLVAIVHHCGYDASRMRGHSSLPGAIDAQIRVDRTADFQMTATVIEAKDFPEGEEITSRLESIELGLDPDGDPVTSLVVLPPDESTLQQVKRKSTKGLGAEQKNALLALTECLAEEGIPPPGAMGLPGSVNKVVGLEQWKEQLFSRGVLERGEGKNWASKWSRLKNKLFDRGHIGIMDERVWRT
jgi:hypothetical protein